MTQQQKQIKLSWEEFEKKYKPIKNKITKREEFNGWLFETYGKDLEYIQYIIDNSEMGASLSRYNIWTIMDCDGATVIGNGYHHVNRMGYVLTKVNFNDDESIEVIDSDDEDRCLKPIVVKDNDGKIAFTGYGLDGIMSELEEAGLIEECQYSYDDMPDWLRENGYTWEFVDNLPE